MFRFKWMILLVLVMFLQPLGPARSEQADYISWRGTIVVRSIHRVSWNIPSGDLTLDGMIEEYYTRTIKAVGDGAASQRIEYTYIDVHEEDCGWGKGEYRKESNVSY